MLEPSPTKHMRITLGLQPLSSPMLAEQHTTLSYLGFLASESRECTISLNRAILTSFAAPAPVLVKNIRDQPTPREEVHQRLMFLKLRGTRLARTAVSSPNLLNSHLSRMITFILTRQRISIQSMILQSLALMTIMVQRCMYAYPALRHEAHNLLRQQAVSALSNVPDTMYQGAGAVPVKFGFEYWANPSNPTEGYITWMSNGQQTQRMSANAVGPDMGTGGSMVGQRLIPEEPMVCARIYPYRVSLIVSQSMVLNLGISSKFNITKSHILRY
jgi:hypothetical protein